MKISTIFKYIFIIFAIAIIVYAGYTIYKNQNEQTENKEEISTVVEENIIKDIRLSLTDYDTMNPLITKNKDVLNIDTLIFEPLFKLTSDYKLENCLAKECSKTGDNVYIIKIDNNIDWQDGLSFISKDIAFTIDLLKQSDSIYKYNVQHIASTEVIDASTIKLTLDGNVPFFEYNLTFPIMSSSYYYGEDFYSSSKIPIGTGKYKIASVSTNNITLTKNEKWRDKDDSKIETIKINLYSSMGEAYNSFKIGNIDLLNTSNPNFQDYIGTIGFNKTEYPGRQFEFLSLNCEDIILQDKAVRQAISYSIDKSNIVSSIFNNKNNVAEYPLDYGNYLYTPNNSSSGYNPEQAKKILEDGGWTYANNRWKKNIEGTTRTLRLKISVNKNNETRIAVAELIKEQLEDIGITVTVDKISDERYGKYIEEKDYQILFTGVYNSYSPDLTYYFGTENIENYSSEKMLELIQNASRINDSKQLIEIYQQIYSLYKEDMPFIGLYRDRNTVISSQSLIGDIYPNNYTTLNGIETWYRKK